MENGKDHIHPLKRIAGPYMEKLYLTCPRYYRKWLRSVRKPTAVSAETASATAANRTMTSPDRSSRPKLLIAYRKAFTPPPFRR